MIFPYLYISRYSFGFLFFYALLVCHEESHMLQFDWIELYDDLNFVEEQVAILVRYIQLLNSRYIHMVKVHWRYLVVGEAT